MNNILITGGTGLIGSAFGMGIKVGSKDYDLTSDRQTHKMFERYRPTTVIHTAAKVGGIGGNIAYPANFYYQNVMMNTNIIHNAYVYGVKKLVCFLSTCVFPDQVSYPLTEEKIHLGPPHTSNAAYAYAKRMADIQIQAYNKQYGTKYFSVIPCNVYGINDNFNLESGHVIPMLIHKCWLAKHNNTAFEVWGDGTPLREFIYAKDVANIVTKLVEVYDETESIIISNPIEHTIKDVVEIIIKYMDFRGEVVWLSEKPNGQHRKPSENQRLVSIIGDYNFTSLDEGLRLTIEWFTRNIEAIRK